MEKYTFEHREPLTQRVILAIRVDTKKQKEQLWLGTEYEVGAALRGLNKPLYLAQVRSLGALWCECGRVFFAPDTRTSLCSERCRKASKKAARRGFDEKAKKLDYEMAYEREYMFWHNRIRKLKKENAPQEKVERAGEELKQFCREALYRKGQVKEGRLSSG